MGTRKRAKVMTINLSETEAESFERSCMRTGVTRADALRAMIRAMSGGELAVICTDEGAIRVVPGPNWIAAQESRLREAL